MRLLRMAIFTLLTAALATSCWKTDEDWSLCGVDDNLVLKFHIQNVADAEFGDHIGTVDVFLFDADHLFIETRRVSAPAADGTWQATFTVEPGIYYAVAWGNAGNRSILPTMDGHNNFENSYIETLSQEGGDPVFYAPYKTPAFLSGTRADGDYSLYEIAVPFGQQTIHETTFGKAHREVEVFISGYENTEHYDGTTAPLVERSGARLGYDFLLRADATPHTLRRQSVPSEREEAAFSTRFYSNLTPIVGDGWVRVCHPQTGVVIGEVKIADYIAANNITDDSYIPVLFVFDMDANVTVTMPSWTDNDITPGIRD